MSQNTAGWPVLSNIVYHATTLTVWRQVHFSPLDTFLFKLCLSFLNPCTCV
eukprot:m.252061 g.252061  ORF g.252061 m.252061 type:complete len:51 (-) comp100819_c0_seq1:279-431(-)